MFFKPPPHVGSGSTAPVLVGGGRVLQEGHSTVPHPGGEEEDPAVDPKVARGVPRRGGVEGDPGVDLKVAEKPIERR